MWSLQGYAQLLFIMVCYFNLLTTAGVEGRNEMFHITTHLTHFNMVIWHWTYGKGPIIYREETHCHHYMGYSY